MSSWYRDCDVPLHVSKVKYTASMLSNNLVATPSLVAYAHRSYPLTIPLLELLPNGTAPDMHIPVSKASSCGKENGACISQMSSGRLYNTDVLVIAYENGVVNIVDATTLLSATYTTIPLGDKDTPVVSTYISALTVHAASNTVFVGLSTGVVFGIQVTLRGNAIANAKTTLSRLPCLPPLPECADGSRTWSAVTTMHAQGPLLAIGTDDGTVLLYQYESYGAAVTEAVRGHAAPILPEWAPYHVFVRPPMLRQAGAGAEAVNGEELVLPMPGLRLDGPPPLRWTTTSTFDSRAFLRTGALHTLPRDITYNYGNSQDVAETKIIAPFCGQEFNTVCPHIHPDSGCPLKHTSALAAPTREPIPPASALETGMYVSTVTLCAPLDLLFVAYSTGHLRVFDFGTRSLLAEVALHTRTITGMAVHTTMTAGEPFALVATVGEDGMQVVVRVSRAQPEESAAAIEIEVCRVLRLNTGTPVGVVWVTRPDTALDGTYGAALISVSYDNHYVNVLPLEWEDARKSS